jgi:membrane-associated protein
LPPGRPAVTPSRVSPSEILDVVLHINDHLQTWTAAYGPWIYAILFLVVFCETGLVVTPFLPGDSLLFATGAIAASGSLNVWIVMPLLIVAAVLGDAVNYKIGHKLGPGFLERKLAGEKPGLLGKLVKKKHLERTQHFYEKYGGKTIILARFVPIVRTFAPFVAGIGNMQYRRFFLFNVIGAIAWVVICVLAGLFFGAIPVVEENFELVVLGIIVVSFIPIAIELVRGWMAQRKTKEAPSP